MNFWMVILPGDWEDEAPTMGQATRILNNVVLAAIAYQGIDTSQNTPVFQWHLDELKLFVPDWFQFVVIKCSTSEVGRSF